MQVVFKPGCIQDGNLTGCGRVVCHLGEALASSNERTDHNDLLRAFAARFRFDRDKVIAQATRLYFRRDQDRIVVCGVRKIDDDALRSETRDFGLPISNAITRA